MPDQCPSWDHEQVLPRTSISVVLVGILLSGCGAGSPGGVAAGARPGTAGGWPATGQIIAAPCPRAYPDRLATAQVAFDGTVTAVGLDEVVPKAGDRRAHVQFAVHEVFTGSPGTEPVLRTWTFFLPPDQQRVVGQRVLVSTGQSTNEIDGCGFSRPWSPSDEGAWRAAFGSR